MLTNHQKHQKLWHKIENVLRSNEIKSIILGLENIAKVHSDYNTYIDNGDLVNWIDSQPERYKNFYTEIYKEGDTTEVIGLFNDFKKSNGIANSTVAPKKTKSKPGVTPETKTVPVVSKAPIGKDDFEAAFDEAVQGE